jgi:hypothetical protein
MNGTPTKTYKRTSPSHTKLYRFGDTNLGLTYGKIIPSVPIFKKSSNKEFNFKDVCLNDHLKRIGLILDQNSLCRRVRAENVLGKYSQQLRASFSYRIP